MLNVIADHRESVENRLTNSSSATEVARRDSATKKSQPPASFAGARCQARAVLVRVVYRPVVLLRRSHGCLGLRTGQPASPGGRSATKHVSDRARPSPPDIPPDHPRRRRGCCR